MTNHTFTLIPVIAPFFPCYYPVITLSHVAFQHHSPIKCSFAFLYLHSAGTQSIFRIMAFDAS